jgi:3-(3-hydroxy-phenyl)propionate hydroxylase
LAGHDDPDVLVVGDRTGALKQWFDGHEESVLFLRPDRCIGGACVAQRTPVLAAALADALSLTSGGNDADRALLHVPQPAPGPPGSVTGTA